MLLGSSVLALGQDVREILRPSSDVYTTLRTYEFEAVDQMSFEIEGVKYRSNVHYGTARGDTPNLALTRQVRAAAEIINVNCSSLQVTSALDDGSAGSLRLAALNLCPGGTMRSTCLPDP